MSRPLTAQEKITLEWNGMAGEWDDLAAGYASGFYDKLFSAPAATGLDPANMSHMTVLDFGCGSGLLTAKLRTICHKVVAIDASPAMIQVLQEKVRGGEWENVHAITAVLGDLGDERVREQVESLYGTVDLVVASSVMTFVPDEDTEATMKVLGQVLKPGGIFCHSDWPKSEAKHPDAMSEEKAVNMYGLGGLQRESTEITPMDMGGGPEQPHVFFGVARKAS